MRISEFDGEWAEFVGVWNLVWPDYTRTVEEAVAEEAIRVPEHFFRRVLARLNGEVVGWANIGHAISAHRAGRFWIDVGVHPDARNAGVGRALWDAMWPEVAAHDVREVKTETREHHAVAVAMLERSGFVLEHREPVSRLEMAGAEVGRYAEVLARVESRYRVLSRTELEAEDPGRWMWRLWRLHVETRSDIPGMAGVEEVPLDAFEKRFAIPGFLGDACFVALDGDELVGVTELHVPQGTPEALRVAYTAVRRAHRRRGIAMALKVKTLEYAKAQGAVSISTDNEENNPMYQINLKLGFQPRPAWMTWIWTR